MWICRAEGRARSGSTCSEEAMKDTQSNPKSACIFERNGRWLQHLVFDLERLS